MIEICTLYDLLPGANPQAYAEFARKAIGSVLQAPGLVEFRANRNLLGSPKVRLTTVWQALDDWAKWVETPAWQAIEAELLTLTTNISTGNLGTIARGA
jgi:heme-degrading monooxygenase HmoA